MKTLIIYTSIHHGNTEKIARAMAEVLGAKLMRTHEADINCISEYDLIGFGSGIYFGKYHRNILNLMDKLPLQKNKKVFIFSTSGMRNGIFQLPWGGNYNKAMKKKLKEKGFDIVGEVSCRGFDTAGPFKFMGGISKGRPNERDLENARRFVRNLRI